MTILEEAHAIVWEMRKNLKDYWPCPDPLDSLRYAATESGEAIDAYLRGSRLFDKRNNHRNNSVESELADCAMMLLTAMPEYGEALVVSRPSFVDGNIDAIHCLVGLALYNCSLGQEHWKYSACDALVSIGLCIDLKEWMLVKRRKFEGKYLPELRPPKDGSEVLSELPLGAGAEVLPAG